MAKRNAQAPSPANEEQIQNPAPEAGTNEGGAVPQTTGVVTPPSSTASTAATGAIGKDQVVIDRADLDKLFNTISDQGKQIDTLFQVADKGRLARLAGSGEGLIKTVKVSKYEGKYVLAWKLTHNQSEIVNGRWIENQATMLILDDPTADGKTSSVEIPLIDFYRKITKDVAEIVKRSSTDEGGKVTRFLQLRFKDGKELSIDENFIN